jgi:tryptophan 2,3-dioxygenase
MEYSKEITDRLEQLEDKYAIMGQDMKSYLDGLLYTGPTKYWEYLGLDTLLTLQQPKTDFPDEFIFIGYHQITELYFRLSLHEFEQIAHGGRNVLPSGEDKGWKNDLTAEYFTTRITRINRYFESLTKSFEIMVDGMERDQFLRYRMSLLPASGFQSAQYRSIEICATDLVELVDKDSKEKYRNSDSSIEEMFEHLYWKQGAVDIETGKKTLTLKQFEDKYSEQLLKLANEYKDMNMWRKYKSLSEEQQQEPNLIAALKMLDVNVNINWPLQHYKSAVKYMALPKGDDTPATGGTNWQKYLPPRFQKRIFFPELWSANEKEEWGKKWVESVIAENKK